MFNGTGYPEPPLHSCFGVGSCACRVTLKLARVWPRGSYAYPPGWTNAKKGDASNCNGKVIVSKVFSAEPKVPSNPGLDDEEPHGTTPQQQLGMCVYSIRFD